MKKHFKWGIANFVFGGVLMALGYYGTFSVSASSNILNSTDAAAKLMIAVFIVGAIFILVSIILFMLSTAAGGKK